MKSLNFAGKSPALIVLENVYGAITSHQGQDFIEICKAFKDENYSFGAVVVDAVDFVPQSRPRLFIIGVRGDVKIPSYLVTSQFISKWHVPALRSAFEKLPEGCKSKWIWWNLKTPEVRKNHFIDLLEDNPASVAWHSPEETKNLLGMMSLINSKKVELARITGTKTVGAIYKRTRIDDNGKKIQRAEVRFDNIAGCLRTPAGGSSRQLIIVVHGRDTRSRLLSSRETARLMGLPESYQLPQSYNDAYHLTGDGVAVPVVRYLAEHIFEVILKHQKSSRLAA